MLDFFKQEVFLLPNWAWFAIAGAIALLLIAIIIVACCAKKGDKAKSDENAPEPVLMPGEEAEKEEKVEKVEEVKEEQPAPVEEPEPVLVEEPVEEKKPAAKKTTATKKTTTTKTTASKPAAKSTTAKKEEAKPAAKPATKTTTTKTAAKPAAADGDDVKTYHISKRTDKKWEVRLDGGDKALKLFFTQKEAIDYVRKLSGKKKILVHKEDGGVREV